MSGKFKMPKPVFSTDDIKHFKELMNLPDPTDDEGDALKQTHLLEGPTVDLRDEVSKSDALANISYCYDWAENCGDPKSELVVYGNFRSPAVQKWLLYQMTYEDSFLWRVARGRMDLADQMLDFDDREAGHA